MTAREAGTARQQFAERPWAFDFWQASTLVEEDAGKASYSVPVRLDFPAAEVDAAESGVLRLGTAGLTGPDGVYPMHVTEMLLRQTRHGNRAPQAFFDLLNNRLVALWRRECIALRPELGPLREDEEPAAAAWLLSVAGMLVGKAAYVALPRAGIGDADAVPLAAGDCMATAPVWSDFPHCAQGIKALCRSFGADCRIDQFQGCWAAFPERFRSRLGGGNRVLGRDAILGRRSFNALAGIQVVVSGCRAGVRRRLAGLIRAYVGEDVRILVETTTTAKGNADGDKRARLGGDPRIRFQAV